MFVIPPHVFIFLRKVLARRREYQTCASLNLQSKGMIHFAKGCSSSPKVSFEYQHPWCLLKHLNRTVHTNRPWHRARCWEGTRIPSNLPWVQSPPPDGSNLLPTTPLWRCLMLTLGLLVGILCQCEFSFFRKTFVELLFCVRHCTRRSS